MLTKGLFFAGTFCCAATLLLASTVGVNAWRNSESPLTTVDRFAHRWDLCSCDGGSATAAAVAGAFCRPTPDDTASEATGSSVAAAVPAVADITLDDLEPYELTVVAYLADRVAAENGVPDFTATEIEEATGVSSAGLDQARLRTGVYLELLRRGADVTSLFGSLSCSRLSACSVHRNLAGASGAELAAYEAERARDGESYSDWLAPSLALPTLDGGTFSLGEQRGHPLALVFLAGHCRHSMDTVPLITALRARHADDGLIIVPIYVNSGSPEDVASWLTRTGMAGPVAVDQNGELATLMETTLVPSTLLVNSQGQVVQRLVGFKDLSALDQALAELVDG